MQSCKLIIEEIVEGLLLHPLADNEALTEFIHELLGDLEEASHQCASTQSSGVREAQELTLEAMQLYYSSLEGILEFLETPDEQKLVQCVYQAEEAHDVLEAARDLIARNKDVLSQYAAA
ncbi:MAG: hypothetical protein AB7S38_38165 [Vulcanimicrobiota bacterium]